MVGVGLICEIVVGGDLLVGEVDGFEFGLYLLYGLIIGVGVESVDVVFGV